MGLEQEDGKEELELHKLQYFELNEYSMNSSLLALCIFNKIDFRNSEGRISHIKTNLE